MEISIGILIALGIILIFLLGMLFGLAFDQENTEEVKKIRMRKTKAYKLGREEEKSATQESALEMACAMINLSDQEIERLEEKENLSSEEKDKLLKLLRRKVKRLKTTNQSQQLIIETLKNKGENEDG